MSSIRISENPVPLKTALYSLLLKLVKERISREEFIRVLDPEILAILVEEIEDPEILDRIMDHTLSKYQFPEKAFVKIKKFITGVKDHVHSICQNNEYLKIYNTTGMNTASCEDLRVRITENGDAIRTFLKTLDGNSMQKFLTMILSSVRNLGEMSITSQEYDDDVLFRWIGGSSVSELINRVDIESQEDLSRYVEDYFCYKLPWAISSYIKISSWVLGVANEKLSEYVKFLPSMVKYGVDSPLLAWALSIGIPTRDLAREVVSDYINAGKVKNFHHFINWFARLRFSRVEPAVQDKHLIA